MSTLDTILDRTRGVLSEIVIILFAVFPLYLFRQSWWDPKKTDPNQRPILLVHGYLHNSSAMIFLRRQLNKAGYKNVFTVDVGAIPFHSLEEYTENLRKRVKEIQELSNRDDLILIGHSMGGVISTYYATQLAKDDGIKVTDIITLGSPLRGTIMHVIGIGECVRQMAYGSDFSKKIVKWIEEEKEIKFFHIGTLADPIVRPPSTTHVAEEMVMFSNLGHIELLFSKRVSHIVLDRLAKTC